MDIYTATEMAYKNGYEQGLRDAVKQGAWEPSDKRWGFYTCSVCGLDDRELDVQPNVRYVNEWNFCPNCGAR